MRLHFAALIACGFIAVTAFASAASACSAPAPAPGVIGSGPVLAVPDSQTVCVAMGPLPSQWVALRIATPDPDLSVSMVMAATFSKRVSCLVGKQGLAQCRLGEEDVRDLLLQPGLRKVATAWH
jgi:hypothetical protein